MNVSCRKLKKLSQWRKISLATWDPPRDPSIYGTLEIDLTRGLAHLEKIRQTSDVKITVTHLVIKSLAMTLAKHPELNVLIRHRNLYLREHVDIFVQVFLEDQGVPDLSGTKIGDADKKTMVEIARELAQKSERIRKLQDPNLKKSKKILQWIPPIVLTKLLRFLSWLTYDWNINGKWLGLDKDPFGGAMVTSVGMFGIRGGFAPIVPFARCPLLLSIGTIEKKPIVVEDKIEIRPVLVLGATIDHRIIDGYLAGIAAKTLREFFENPENL